MSEQQDTNKDNPPLTTRLSVHIGHALHCAMECSSDEVNDTVVENLLEAAGFLLAARRAASQRAAFSYAATEKAS